MNIKRRYFFLLLNFILCFTLCSESCGANKRRRKPRSKHNGITAVADTAQNTGTHVTNNGKLPQIEKKVLLAQDNTTAINGKKRLRRKRRTRHLQEKKDNPKEQQEGLSVEDAPKTQEMPDVSIPQELKELDQRKSQEEESNKIKKDKEINKEDTIEFYFENTDLQNVVTQIAQLYNVTFITDDIIAPPVIKKVLLGNKISFKTHKPLTKKEGWNLFLTFLDIAGFAIIPEADPSMFRITTVDNAKRAAIPSYIGVDSSILPDTDQLIRYVYFVENINPEILSTADKKGIIDQMLSSSAGPSFVLRELKALVITDKAYNIKMLMKIIKELDKISMPQAMSVLKLNRADAEEVKKLYTEITKTEEQTVMTRLFPARKQPTSLYFPESVRVIAESRTNSLILLGPRDAIEKIESFVQKFIDVEPDKPYSPLHTYQLQYADASTVANIMNEVTKFGREPVETAAGKVGGVRGIDKYFRPMLFIPEPSTNQLIIRGDYEDYLRTIDIVKELDEAQPQVAIEILILTVDLQHVRELGTQLRSKDTNRKGLFGGNIEFQAANLGNVITKGTSTEKVPGCKELLGNLLKIVQGTAGNTVVSLGCDAFGVWGVFKVLETIANSEVISNPFLMATNKTEAKVSIGQVKRLKTATIVGVNTAETFGDAEATLTVTVIPQITSDGMIGLDLNIGIKEFIGEVTADTAARSIREISTKTTVADNEIIALGGLIRNDVSDNTVKTPLLGDIPLLGWLFKDRSKSDRKSNLLILVWTKIIEPGSEADIKRFTDRHIDDYYGSLGEMYAIGQKRDPIHKLFFEEGKKDVTKRVEDLLFKDKKKKRTRRKRKTKPKTSKAGAQEVVKPYTTHIEKPHIPSHQGNNMSKTMACKHTLEKRKGRRKISITDFIDDRGESLA